MVLIVIGLIVIGIAVCYGFVKAVNAVFNPAIKRLSNNENPYIKAHTNRKRNDAYYEEYLNWMDKTNSDLPIDKVVSEEERSFFRKINS